jgi:hypothetical protein
MPFRLLGGRRCGRRPRLGWPTGLEPATTGTTIRGSTIELRPPFRQRTPNVAQVVGPPSRFWLRRREIEPYPTFSVGQSRAMRIVAISSLSTYDSTLTSSRKCTDQPNCLAAYSSFFSSSHGSCLSNECSASLLLNSTRCNATKSGLVCLPLRPDEADLWVKQ